MTHEFIECHHKSDPFVLTVTSCIFKHDLMLLAPSLPELSYLSMLSILQLAHTHNTRKVVGPLKNK